MFCEYDMGVIREKGESLISVVVHDNHLEYVLLHVQIIRTSENPTNARRLKNTPENCRKLDRKL